MDLINVINFLIVVIFILGISHICNFIYLHNKLYKAYNKLKELNIGEFDKHGNFTYFK